MARYLITLDPGVHADNAAAHAAITAAGASVIKSYSFSLTFEIEASEEQVSGISGVAEFIAKSTVAPVEVHIANQEHLTHLALTSYNSNSYQPKNTGTGGHVYLVDTGLFLAHEQFLGRTINNLYSNFGDDFTDTVGHGTAVASVIIGNTQGVSKDATLHNVKLFDSAASNITVGEIIDALDEVLAHHLGSGPSQVKVVCLPWTTTQSNFLDNKVIELNQNNLIVVAAAGNDGVDVSTKSPAGVRPVVTVGAYDSNYNVTSFTNVPWNDPATAYSNNYGASLDIFALGVNISCATIDADDSYSLVSGTSISAGLVAGIAVQWANIYTAKTSSELKDIILQEGHIKGGELYFEEGSNIALSDVFRSVLTTSMIDQVTLGNLPSGRVMTIQLGQTATLDLELNLEEGTDFSVLDFSPMPPWANINLETGILSVDLTSVDSSLAPGVYLFGLKGTVSGKTVVEEYSIGVYANDITELDTATQYYYDTDTGNYDEVISYQVAPVAQK